MKKRIAAGRRQRQSRNRLPSKMNRFSVRGFRALRFEPLETRLLLCNYISGNSDLEVNVGLTELMPELPGLHLEISDPHNVRGQIVYLNFDGQQQAIYDGPVRIGPLDVPAYEPPADLTDARDDIIESVTASLNDMFCLVEVSFTTAAPDPSLEFSTIFIGGDGTPFAEHGVFLGLAEQVDMDNHDRSWHFARRRNNSRA